MKYIGLRFLLMLWVVASFITSLIWLPIGYTIWLLTGYNAVDKSIEWMYTIAKNIYNKTLGI